MTKDLEDGPTRKPIHLIAWLTVTLTMALFLCLLIGVARAPDFLAVASIGGLTRGHILVLLIHILPVAAAWLYICKGPEPEQ